MPTQDTQRRKRLLILPKFQLIIISINLGVILATTLVIWVSAERFLFDIRPAAGLSSNEAAFFKNYIDYQIGQLRTMLAFTLIGGMFVSGLITLFMSHRLAGPMIRLRNYFTSAAATTPPYPELTFRDGDYLSELPSLINKTLENAGAKASTTK